MLGDVLPFLAIPAVAAVLGGVVAAFRPPGRRLQSVIQHFAGGVVFAVSLALFASSRSFPPLLVALVLFYPASGAFVTLRACEPSCAC